MDQVVYHNWKEENDIPFLNNHKCGLSIHDWLAEQNLLFMKWQMQTERYFIGILMQLELYQDR